MEDGLDGDVSLHFYQHYQLISFISITPSLLLAEGCHLDRACVHTHARTGVHIQIHTRLFIRSAVIGPHSFEIENMIS